MLKLYKISRCFLTLLAGAALTFSLPVHACEQEAGGHKSGKHTHMAPKTLAEARERAQKRLDKLNGMTEEEWQKQKEHRRMMKENKGHGKQLPPASGGTMPPEKAR